ncbi:hypothetical protein SPLC1_S171560 [Arthrospira platensis C1]|nr:hypothetical protein SPLC1_S171560 [Arthrospira platensis C1]
MVFVCAGEGATKAAAPTEAIAALIAKEAKALYSIFKDPIDMW